MAAHSFTANAPLPVRLRTEARVSAPGVWRPDEFRYDVHGAFFDHFLVRDPTGRHDVAWPDARAMEEVFREGAWRVYRGRSDIKRINGGSNVILQALHVAFTYADDFGLRHIGKQFLAHPIYRLVYIIINIIIIVFSLQSISQSNHCQTY